MSYIHPAAVEHQRRRWTRHDAWRFATPGSPEAERPGGLHPWAAVARAADHAAGDAAFTTKLRELQASQHRLRRMLADLKFELAWRRIVRKYSPDQPRVPAGSREGGQWTSGSSGQGSSAKPEPIRLAAEKPSVGPGTIAAIALEAALKLIDAYRKQNGPWDLFGRKVGTATVTTIDGKDFYGSNSTGPSYSTVDDREARQMREILIAKYPEVMQTDNIG